MATDHNPTTRRWSVKKITITAIVGVLAISAIYLYRNFNRILSEALQKSFNSGVMSDVYELKFENLQVNLITGSIKVFNVTLTPREKPLRDYSYINSSFSLRTENLLLQNVEIRTLLEDGVLIVESISINRPQIEFLLNGTRHIMLPFKDTTSAQGARQSNKRPIESFSLKKFELNNAVFHSINSNAEREFRIDDLSIAVHDLDVAEKLGEYLADFDHVSLSIGTFDGNLKKDRIEHLAFRQFLIGFDSMHLQLRLDTMTFAFQNFNTTMSDLKVQTADSLFQLGVKAFDLSYKDKTISVTGFDFKPNVSHAVIQKRYKFQHTEFAGSVGQLMMRNVNFDSLIYWNHLFVGEIEMNELKAAIFKDKRKTFDSTRFPIYPGQSIAAIDMPLRIKRINISSVDLENTELKPDGSAATVRIGNGSLQIDNVTNLDRKKTLVVQADAYLNGKVKFNTSISFSYDQPKFDFTGKLGTFSLPDLNPLLAAYTPGKINRGIADGIEFSGTAEERSASGNMRFLYHDLEVDLELHEHAKWKSDFIAFAANSALNSSNPVSADLPAREVKFRVERDMNKSFVNVIIKSILNGVKETMIMNKENRKAFKESKKKKSRGSN